MFWRALLISAFKRKWQADFCDSEASLVNIIRPYLKKEKEKEGRKEDEKRRKRKKKRQGKK